jgi:Anti-sigma-K factor rskA/Putative zinc-finger
MTPVDSHECERRVLDAAAYVLGALSEHEYESYRAHLAGCVECSAEVARLQPVADSLALGVARMQAPEDLRARLMAAVNGEAELLHAAGHEADRVPRGRGSWRMRLGPALAAGAALAAGLLIGALAINTGSSTRTRTQTIEAVVATPGYHATAALRKAGSHVELVVTGMPAPPPGRIYEVWLEHGTQAPAPTDVLFSVTNAGAGSVGVPGNLNGVSKVLVTDEPLGGSLKPTRTPVIVASV